MLAWSIVAALYVIGFVGLHAQAQTVNGGPIHDRRAWINLILWPVVIPWAKLADAFDAING